MVFMVNPTGAGRSILFVPLHPGPFRELGKHGVAPSFRADAICARRSGQVAENYDLMFIS